MANIGDMVVRVVGDNAELDSAIDKSWKKTKKYLDDMAKFGKQWSVFVTAPIVAGLGLAVKSFSEAEAATKRLSGAIQLAGTFTTGATKRLSDFATELMRTTGVSDEMIRNLTAQAVAMGRTEEEAKKLATAAVDIAARGILPLDAAFEALQVTYEGIAPRSKELRAITGELTEAQLRAGVAVDKVAAAVKGAGVEMRTTTEGTMKNFANSMDELGESFGAVIAPAFNKLLDTIAGFADKLGTLDDSTKKTIVAFAGVMAVAGPLLVIIPKIVVALRTMSTAFATSTGPIGLVVAGVGLLVAGIVKIIGLSKEFAEKQKLMDDATKGNLKSTEEYNAAIGLMSDKTRELNEQKADLQKAASGELKITKNLADTASMLGQAQAALSTQGREESARKVKALEAEIAAENARIAAATKNRDKLTAAEKKAADEAAAAAKREAEEAAAEAERAANAAAALKEKEEGIRAVREALETAGLTEQQIIDKEIEKLREWGFTDAEIMAYMKQTHADFYAAEVEAAKDTWGEFITLREDYSGKVAAINQKELEEQNKRLEEIKEEEKKKEKESADDKIATWVGYGQRVLDILAELFSAIDAARQRDLAKELAALDKTTNAQLAAVDERMQAELWSRGLVEARTEEQYRTEIAAALAAGDAERAAALQKSLDILLITEAFEAEKTAIEAAAAKKKALLEYNAALASWRMQLTLGIADAAMAVLNGLLTKPFVPAGIIAGALAGVLGGIQIAAIAKAKPQMPALAEGGIALPTPGGSVVNVAEAGRAEAIIPLDQLDKMLSRAGPGGFGGEGGDIHLVVKIDSKPILDSIFPATRNRTVLIDSRAVVA